MKQFVTTCLAMLAIALLANAAFAQAEKKDDNDDNKVQPRVQIRRFNAQRGEGNRDGERGPRGGMNIRRFVSPIMEALDKDKDGTLSAEEIENASTALKALDKDKDGKLSAEELRPSFGGLGGRVRGPGQGGQPISFTDRIMELDKNKDGKITSDEIPERMKNFLERIDENKDGVIDKAEIEKMSERMQQNRPSGRRPQSTPEKGDAEKKASTKPDDDI